MIDNHADRCRSGAILPGRMQISSVPCFTTRTIISPISSLPDIIFSMIRRTSSFPPRPIILSSTIIILTTASPVRLGSTTQSFPRPSALSSTTACPSVSAQQRNPSLGLAHCHPSLGLAFSPQPRRRTSSFPRPINDHHPINCVDRPSLLNDAHHPSHT
jgi:hypothetical protein